MMCFVSVLRNGLRRTAVAGAQQCARGVDAVAAARGLTAPHSGVIGGRCVMSSCAPARVASSECESLQLQQHDVAESEVMHMAAALQALAFVNADALRATAQQQQQQLLPEKSPLIPIFEAVKREFQPNFLRRKRNHGFLKRIRKKSGQRIVNFRRTKGRKRIAA